MVSLLTSTFLYHTIHLKMFLTQLLCLSIRIHYCTELIQFHLQNSIHNLTSQYCTLGILFFHTRKIRLDLVVQELIVSIVLMVNYPCLSTFKCFGMSINPHIPICPKNRHPETFQSGAMRNCSFSLYRIEFSKLNIRFPLLYEFYKDLGRNLRVINRYCFNPILFFKPFNVIGNKFFGSRIMIEKNS